MIVGLPSYIFFLLCCYQEGCCHPLCQSGRPRDSPVWYVGGPSISCLPLPVPDPDRPWGSPTCLSCKPFCSGHYKQNCFTDVYDRKALTSVASPPSLVLKEIFCQTATDVLMSDEFIKEVAEKVLLPCDEVKIWFQHLKMIHDNRKRGAAKAAATRQSKQSRPMQQWHCGQCGVSYQSTTHETELWIACDVCDKW